ncbi:hypothetical protein DFH09DRAFT_1275597 [Mycena vulgaris]|nr:hypothetical protein DFH09DRAFT_1275597 [Mycena vulgaris]
MDGRMGMLTPGFAMGVIVWHAGIGSEERVMISGVDDRCVGAEGEGERGGGLEAGCDVEICDREQTRSTAEMRRQGMDLKTDSESTRLPTPCRAGERQAGGKDKENASDVMFGKDLMFDAKGRFRLPRASVSFFFVHSSLPLDEPPQMQASMTTVMPPTTYALPSTHRAHLIRSTRKLGALLGETPLLLDQDSASSISRGHTPSNSISSISSTNSDSKRAGRIFPVASPPPPRTSSLAAADAPTPSRAGSNTPEPSAPARPHLYLRLATPGARPASLALASPLLSPGFTGSPLSPAFPPSVDRRRKMAKLVRTLGQNVPPELVFSSAPRDSEAQAPSYHSPSVAPYYTANRTPSPSYIPSPTVVPALLSALSPAPSRRSLASPVSPTSPTSPTSLASPTREAAAMSYDPAAMVRARSPAPDVGSRAHHRSASALGFRFRSASRSSSREDEWVAVAPVASSYPPRSPMSPRSPHYVKASPAWNAEFSSTSSEYRGPRSPPAHESTTSRSTHDARFLSRHFEFRGASPAPFPANGIWDDDEQDEGRDEHQGENATYRREAGWSGEWSGAGAGGMEDVVSRLRGLKMNCVRGSASLEGDVESDSGNWGSGMLRGMQLGECRRGRELARESTVLDARDVSSTQTRSRK